MDDGGQILHRLRTPTPTERGYKAILDNIAEQVHQLDRLAQTCCTVGIGTPGAISSKTGRMKNCNTVCLNDQDIKGDLSTLLDRPIRIANDANCFALSEAIDGAGTGHAMVFGVIMGTGVGGGLVINQQLHVGPQHIAGEWGHNPLHPRGYECYCGKSGCVEAYLSGTGLLRRWQSLQTGQELSTEQIVTLANTSNHKDRLALHAQQCMERYLNDFGRAIANVINILDPDVIVLGGGMSNIGALYTEGVKAASNHVFNDQMMTPIVRNQHGDSSGVRGATQLWTT